MYALLRELASGIVAFEGAAAHSVGMTAAERKCAELLLEKGKLTPSELAEATGMTSGAMTGIVDRLVRAGYAVRVANPDDRRSVLVQVRRASQLAVRFGPFDSALTAAMDQVHASYSRKERDLIRRYLTELITTVRCETDKHR